MRIDPRHVGIITVKECKKCGQCCYIWVYTDTEELFQTRCPKLTEDNLCSIYEWRPIQCREWECKREDI